MNNKPAFFNGKYKAYYEGLTENNEVAFLIMGPGINGHMRHVKYMENYDIEDILYILNSCYEAGSKDRVTMIKNAMDPGHMEDNYV